MSGRAEILRAVMAETAISQSELSRLSGVHQPSISQMLGEKIEMSDDQLDRLLACMGYRLEVMRSAVEVEMTRSERRSWSLNRRIAAQMTATTWREWQPLMEANIARLRAVVHGQPHLRHLDRWERYVKSDDLGAVRRVLTGVDRESIEMREVSPMSGALSQEERGAVLAGMA